MSPRSQRRDPFAYGNSRGGTFSAWTMAIVFAAVAVVSFAIDQTLSVSPNTEESNAPSVLHPVQLLQSLMDAASD
jgi:dipeptidyl aminopeptidase/acylaminoacyl peptidase